MVTFGKDRKWLQVGFWALFAVGLALHGAFVWRPIDYRSLYIWRESDMGMIARNFWRDGMNILYPRIDWAGDGPGYVESEFPLLPWLMALGYHVVGYCEAIGRVIVLGFSFLTLWGFHLLASRLLTPFQARWALLFFCLNPIMVRFATTIQPDVMIMPALVFSVYFFLRWHDDERWRYFFLCATTGAFAILLKSPAIYIGIFFALFCIERHRRGLRYTCKVLGLALLILLPAALWYKHAYRFWIEYGNSLGVSNQIHWIGLDLLSRPTLLATMLVKTGGLEVIVVFCFVGLALALPVLPRAWREKRILLYWLGAAAVFHLVTINTTSHLWAYYYHCLSVPPACLLMGFGVSNLAWERAFRLRRISWRRYLHPALCLLSVLACIAVSIAMLSFPDGHKGYTVQIYETAERFGPQMVEEGLVLHIRPTGPDAAGRPAADDYPVLLFWLDRKGCLIRPRIHSMTDVERLRRKGARYYIGSDNFDLVRELEEHFRVLDRHGGWVLGELVKQNH